MCAYQAVCQCPSLPDDDVSYVKCLAVPSGTHVQSHLFGAAALDDIILHAQKHLAFMFVSLNACSVLLLVRHASVHIYI